MPEMWAESDDCALSSGAVQIVSNSILSQQSRVNKVLHDNSARLLEKGYILFL